MTIEERKFWENWYYNNEDKDLTPNLYFLHIDRFLEAIKFAQEEQKKKDVIRLAKIEKEYHDSGDDVPAFYIRVAMEVIMEDRNE